MSSRKNNSSYNRRAQTLSKTTTDLSKTIRKFDNVLSSGVQERTRNIKELVSSMKTLSDMSKSFNRTSNISIKRRFSDSDAMQRNTNNITKSVSKLAKIIKSLDKTVGKAPESLKKVRDSLKRAGKFSQALANISKKVGNIPSISQMRAKQLKTGIGFRAGGKVIKGADVKTVLSQYGLSWGDLPFSGSGAKTLAKSQKKLYGEPLKQELGLDTPRITLSQIRKQRFSKTRLGQKINKRKTRMEDLKKEFKEDKLSKRGIRKISRERMKIDRRASRELRIRQRRENRANRANKPRRSIKTGIGNLFKGIGKAFKGIKALTGMLKAIKFLQPIFDMFSGVISILIGMLTSTLIPILNVILSTFLTPEVMAIFSAIAEQFGLLVGMVSDLLASLDVTTLLDVFLSLIEGIIGVLTSDAVQSILKNLLDTVIKILPELLRIIEVLLPIVVLLLEALEPLIPILTSIIVFVVMLAAELVEKLSPVLEGLGKVVAFVFTLITEGIAWLVNSVITILNKVPGVDIKPVNVGGYNPGPSTGGSGGRPESIKPINQQVPMLASQGIITKSGIAEVHAGEMVVKEKTISTIVNDTFYIENRFYGSYEKQQRKFKDSVDEMYKRSAGRY